LSMVRCGRRRFQDQWNIIGKQQGLRTLRVDCTGCGLAPAPLRGGFSVIVGTITGVSCLLQLAALLSAKYCGVRKSWLLQGLHCKSDSTQHQRACSA
jgi:hypothetical protein